MNKQAIALAALIDSAATPQEVLDVIYEHTGHHIKRTTLWRLSNDVGESISLPLATYVLEHQFKEAPQ